MIIKPKIVQLTQELLAPVETYLLSTEAFNNKLAPNEPVIIHKELSQALENNSVSYWVLLEKDTVIGTTGIIEDEYGTGLYHLGYFSVHNGYRQQGHGTRLLQFSEIQVRKQGGKGMIIYTWSGKLLEPARNLYLKSGYKEVGRYPDFYKHGQDLLHFYKLFGEN